MAKDMDKYVLKSDVLRVAREVAEEQGWCKEGMKEALERLDIEIPTRRVSVTVPVDVTVILTVTDGETDEDAVRIALENADNIEYNIEASEGWSLIGDEIEALEYDTFEPRPQDAKAEVV